ncbi:hypothetical protein [Neisseria iguanae]|uniref:hypothetical protein n=1 Tax=Neisseria iguanae TaxID=90242 RepID=UPI001FE3EA5E|nr:hypothetical protein [Neisseria iguanae]
MSCEAGLPIIVVTMYVADLFDVRLFLYFDVIVQILVGFEPGKGKIFLINIDDGGVVFPLIDFLHDLKQEIAFAHTSLSGEHLNQIFAHKRTNFVLGAEAN